MNIDEYLGQMDKLVGDLELAIDALHEFADQNQNTGGESSGEPSDEQALRCRDLMDRIQDEGKKIT